MAKQSRVTVLESESQSLVSREDSSCTQIFNDETDLSVKCLKRSYSFRDSDCKLQNHGNHKVVKCTSRAGNMVK